MLETENRATTEQICWLDSDIIVMDEPQELELPLGLDMAACAPDKSIGTPRQDDENTPYWEEICKVVGLRLEDLPWVRAQREGVDIRLYFNSGIFSYRKTSRLALLYQQCMADLLNARVSSRVSNIYFSEQAALGLAVVKGGLHSKHPHGYNYAVGRKITDLYEPDKVRHAKILHYHDAMWPEFWPTLMDRLKTDRPEVHAWLQTLGPLQNRATPMQKTIGKLLGTFRDRKLKKHRDSSRIF